MELAELNAQVFAACLRSTFRILLPGGEPVPVELTEVSERHDSTRLEQFSLIFYNSTGAYLPQAIYAMDHERLGRISLFLVPLGPVEGRGMSFQAVFNRFRRQPDLPA